jgi:dihydropteroate synthase
VKLRATELELSSPQIMAVLNTTPDSFSDGGALYNDKHQLDLSLVLTQVESFLQQGANIIDVGGESTRPGAEPVSIAEELERVIPVVEAVSKRFDVAISVDTSTPAVMTESAKVGASLINDVRALGRPGALEAAAETGLPVCLMHMSGEPGSMQDDPQYDDFVREVCDFLLARVGQCVEVGIDTGKILLDPGFGFGKTLTHNLTLFRHLDQLVALGFPLMVGVSRKSMIGAILDKPVDQRIIGSVAMAMLAAQRGAQILRVHDVSATADALKILKVLEDINDG